MILVTNMVSYCVSYESRARKSNWYESPNGSTMGDAGERWPALFLGRIGKLKLTGDGSGRQR